MPTKHTKWTKKESGEITILSVFRGRSELAAMQFLQYYGIDWVATACGLLGVYLLGNKNKVGFVVFMFASISWITFGVLTGSLAVIIGSSVFLLMHLRGWLNWTKAAKFAPSD